MAKPTLYDGMIHELVARGWGGSVRDGKWVGLSDFIPPAGPVTAEQFADWQIQAAGHDLDMVNNQTRRWQQKLVEIFVRHMGAEIVEASILR